MLPARPYEEQTEWPFVVRRPVLLPSNPHGPILLVRSLRAGPGLEARGLRARAADGSVTVAHYEEWDLPPAQAMEDALRIWLSQCGRFSAVVAPGSRATADFSIEGELTRFIAIPSGRRTEVALSLVVFREIDGHAVPVVQQVFAATSPLPGDAASDSVRSLIAATSLMFGEIESVVVAAAG